MSDEYLVVLNGVPLEAVDLVIDVGKIETTWIGKDSYVSCVPSSVWRFSFSCQWPFLIQPDWIAGEISCRLVRPSDFVWGKARIAILEIDGVVHPSVAKSETKGRIEPPRARIELIFVQNGSL